MRILILLLLCGFLFAGGGQAAFSSEANVFVYHRFGDDRYPSTNISLKVFESQLKLLRDGGYTVLPLGEIVSVISRGGTLPPRCAALTVDDGYTTFLTGAMPLLRRYGFPATLFVSTGSVGNPGYLGWKELKSLAAEGIEIGNHSHSHPYLVNRLPGEDQKAWRTRVRNEVRRSQELFSEFLGHSPRLFAYPYGEYDPEVMEILREAGFVAAAAQTSGVIGRGANLFELPRFPMGGDYATLAEFTEKLRMKALPVTVRSPKNPVLAKGQVAEMVVDVDAGVVDVAQLRCFGGCTLVADPKVPGRFRVLGSGPHPSRRIKFTITAPGRRGGWFWYSQLWIQPAKGGEDG